MIEQIKGMFTKNIVWILLVIFGAGGLYLDSRYISVEEYKESKVANTLVIKGLSDRIDAIETADAILNTQRASLLITYNTEFTTINRRLENKIDLLKDVIEEVDILENKLIKLETLYNNE